MGFTKAVKKSAKLRMALAGPSGSGKTWTALAIATALANGQSVAVIDTERGSASKYADQFSFDVLELDTFDPRKYVEAIHDAEAGGYTVLVIDSLSHAWNGTGGLLEIVEGIAKRNKGGNTFAAWADATPIQNQLINAITSARLHIIATMRSKQEHVQERDEKTGRMTVRKVGMAPVQREGMEYEFDVFADLDQDNTLIVQKSRCPALTGAVIARPGADVARVLAAWLSGEAPAHEPAPAQPAQATRTASAAPAKPAPKPAPASDEGEPPWVTMRTRIRAVGMTDRRDVDRLCEQVGVKGGWDAASTWDHYHRIDKRITALESAKASAEAKLKAAESAATPATDTDAAADFPADDTASDVPGARDMRELPVPAMRP